MRAFMSDRPARDAKTAQIWAHADNAYPCSPVHVFQKYAQPLALAEARAILAESEPRTNVSDPDAGLDYPGLRWLGASVYPMRAETSFYLQHGGSLGLGLDAAAYALAESLRRALDSGVFDAR